MFIFTHGCVLELVAIMFAMCWFVGCFYHIETGLNLDELAHIFFGNDDESII